VERWSKRVMEALGRRGGDKVGDVFVEDYLRELWERSRAWISHSILPKNRFDCMRKTAVARKARYRTS
jgi:hypothetical protein